MVAQRTLGVSYHWYGSERDTGMRPRSSTMSLPEVMAWLNAQNDVIPVGCEASAGDDNGDWDDSWDEAGRADPDTVEFSTVRPSPFPNHA